MENWMQFMGESNSIEGENYFNPGDEEAFEYAIRGIDTEHDIITLHSILGKHLNKDWVGRYRNVAVYVGTYRPPKASDVPIRMLTYCDDLRLLNSFDAHNKFELIHPFHDLNGRVGRLIWVSKVIDEGYTFSIPFLQKYYYQTLSSLQGV